MKTQLHLSPSDQRPSTPPFVQGHQNELHHYITNEQKQAYTNALQAAITLQRV